MRHPDPLAPMTLTMCHHASRASDDSRILPPACRLAIAMRRHDSTGTHPGVVIVRTGGENPAVRGTLTQSGNGELAPSRGDRALAGRRRSVRQARTLL
jgi:hypothetical protein